MRDQSEKQTGGGWMEQHILYRGMEQADAVPALAWVETEEGRKVLLPLREYTQRNERWEEGFQLKLQRTGEDANAFLLGNQLVKQTEQTETSYAALLAAAGLDPDFYQIEALQLPAEGEGYALGRKRVWDCEAVYGGYAETGFEAETSEAEQIALPVQAGEIRPSDPWWMAAVAAVVVLGMMGAAAFRRLSGRVDKRRKEIVYLFWAAVFLAGGAACAVYLWLAAGRYRADQAVYEQLRRTAWEAPEREEGGAASPGQAAEAEDGGQPEEALLRQQNPDYRLWLQLPGTSIDYPVVQSKDNQYYLNHGFGREENSAGAVFLDGSRSALRSRNTVIYAHNRKDGTMFADLKKYRDPSFFREHSQIRLFYQGQWIVCPIFSCQLLKEGEAAPYREPSIAEEWEDWKREMEEASLFETGVIPAQEDKIITLSTCYGAKGRMVVQAVVGVDFLRALRYNMNTGTETIVSK